MSQELLYTSAPQGLKPGSRGFCTVLSTRGMPAPLANGLEALSGYRPVFPSSDPRASSNPVVQAHVKLPVAGRTWHVLSRIADYGLDYSQRTNKLAHHVVLDPGELVESGPAQLLIAQGFMRTEWDETPALAPPKPVKKAPSAPIGVCRAWKEVTGDAGWAGVLAESFLSDPDRPVFLLFEPGQDPLPLIAESLSLLPPEKRWEVTFSTYFTGLPQGVTCVWRCLLKGSPEANQSQRFPRALRIDLTSPSHQEASGGKLVEAARSGVLQRSRSRPSLHESDPLDLDEILIEDDSPIDDDLNSGPDEPIPAQPPPLSESVYRPAASTNRQYPNGADSSMPPRRRRLAEIEERFARQRSKLRVVLAYVCVVVLIITLGLSLLWIRLRPHRGEKDHATAKVIADKPQKGASSPHPAAPPPAASAQNTQKQPSANQSNAPTAEEKLPVVPAVVGPAGDAVAKTVEAPAPADTAASKPEHQSQPSDEAAGTGPAVPSDSKPYSNALHTARNEEVTLDNRLSAHNPYSSVSLWAPETVHLVLKNRKSKRTNAKATYSVNEKGAAPGGELVVFDIIQNPVANQDGHFEYSLCMTPKGVETKVKRLKWCELVFDSATPALPFHSFPIQLTEVTPRIGELKAGEHDFRIIWPIATDCATDYVPELYVEALEIQMDGFRCLYQPAGTVASMAATLPLKWTLTDLQGHIRSKLSQNGPSSKAGYNATDQVMPIAIRMSIDLKKQSASTDLFIAMTMEGWNKSVSNIISYQRRVLSQIRNARSEFHNTLGLPTVDEIDTQGPMISEIVAQLKSGIGQTKAQLKSAAMDRNLPDLYSGHVKAIDLADNDLDRIKKDHSQLTTLDDQIKSVKISRAQIYYEVVSDGTKGPRKIYVVRHPRQD